jgi:hypothetical protein
VRSQTSAGSFRAELQAIAALGRDDEEAQRLEASLIDFVEAAWASIDASEFKSCRAIDALCEHLQAVTDGQIKKILVNFPPRCAKTLVTSVCWPAWTWSRRARSSRRPNQRVISDLRPSRPRQCAYPLRYNQNRFLGFSSRFLEILIPVVMKHARRREIR